MPTHSQAKYPVQYGMEKKFRFRWRVVTKNGDVAHSDWDKDSGLKCSVAMSCPTANTFHLDIEDVVSGEIQCLLETTAKDFDEFRWYMAATVNPLGVKGVQKMTGTLIGCIVVTKTEEFTVMISGKVKVEKRK